MYSPCRLRRPRDSSVRGPRRGRQLQRSAKRGRADPTACREAQFAIQFEERFVMTRDGFNRRLKHKNSSDPHSSGEVHPTYERQLMPVEMKRHDWRVASDRPVLDSCGPLRDRPYSRVRLRRRPTPAPMRPRDSGGCVPHEADPTFREAHAFRETTDPCLVQEAHDWWA
jgi:hypothetical protein